MLPPAALGRLTGSRRWEPAQPGPAPSPASPSPSAASGHERVLARAGLSPLDLLGCPVCSLGTTACGAEARSPSALWGADGGV